MLSKAPKGPRPAVVIGSTILPQPRNGDERPHVIPNTEAAETGGLPPKVEKE